MKKDVQIGIRMSSEMRDELRQLATADNRSLASYIVHVLSTHLAKHSKAKR